MRSQHSQPRRAEPGPRWLTVVGEPFGVMMALLAISFPEVCCWHAVAPIGRAFFLCCAITGPAWLPGRRLSKLNGGTSAES